MENNYSKLSRQDVFNTVLEIENTQEILDFVVPKYDFPLWPYVRYYVLQNCIKEIYKEDNIFSKVKDVKETSKHKILFNFFKQNILFFRKKNILFHTAVESNMFKESSGTQCNHYIEGFINIFPNDSLYIDVSSNSELFKNHKDFSVLRAYAISIIAGKCSTFISDDKYINCVNSFVKFIENRIQAILGLNFSQAFYEYLYDKLLYVCKITIIEYHLYKFIFRNKFPKICIMQTAYYGGNEHIIRLLKDNGCIVAENQHSAMYKSHIAYNWASSLCNSTKLKQYCVDYLLTYGTYWISQCRTPSESYVIGNPWFSMSKKVAEQCSEDAILFALSAFYDDFIPIIEAVKVGFPEKKIIIRPHPAEKKYFLNHPLAKMHDVAVDLHPDIYDSFAKCNIVIGETSTSMVEAAACGKRVFIKKGVSSDTRFPDEYFTFFSRPTELVELMQEPWDMPEDASDVFFNRNWKENYIKFIHKYA